MASVGQRLVKSAGWSITGDLLTALSSAAALLVAARFVPKAEIGLVSVVMLLLALVEMLTASGIEQALVQRPQDDVASRLDAAWTWQLGRGFAIGLCLVLGAPLLARFYNEPALENLTYALAAQPILRGATNIALVLKLRALDFRAAFVMSVAPALLRLAVIVPLSLLWRNAWALVAAALTEHVIRLLLSFVLLPRRPRLRVRWTEIAPLLRYGRWLTGMAILSYVTMRGDDVFVSKYFGAADLAVYQLAFGLASVPVTAVTHVLSRVTFPAYARLHAESGELRDAFHEVLRITTLAALVAASALFCALPFLPVIVGPQWTNAVDVGRVLVVSGALRGVLATGGPLFLATGRPALDVVMNLPRLVALVALLGPFASVWGLAGVAWASFASVCTCVPTWVYGIRAQASVTLQDVAKVLAPSLLASAVAALVFGSLAATLPHDQLGFLGFATFGIALTFLLLSVGQRVLGVALLPSLRRLKAI